MGVISQNLICLPNLIFTKFNTMVEQRYTDKKDNLNPIKARPKVYTISVFLHRKQTVDYHGHFQYGYFPLTIKEVICPTRGREKT